MARRPKLPPAEPARSREPDWSRELARPVRRHGYDLQTLGDAIELVNLQPANRRAYPTWRAILRALKDAAAGGDIEAATKALADLLVIDPVLRPRTRPRR